MAKKSKAVKKVDPVDATEKAIREALAQVPELDHKIMGEEQYCDVVLDALDLVAEGLRMRKQELLQELEVGHPPADAQ